MFGFGRREKGSGKSIDTSILLQSINDDSRDTLTGKAYGLVNGTCVATSKGWCPVEKVLIGDSVLTFDAGLENVISISHDLIWKYDQPCPRKFWPLFVPAGAIGNIDETLILPEQIVMIKAAAATHGGVALLAASSLVGWRGIRRVIPCRPVQIVTLKLASDQVVLANVGLQFLCNGARTGPANDSVEQAAVTHRVLSAQQAATLMARLEFDDLQSGAMSKAIAPKDRIYAAFAA